MVVRFELDRDAAEAAAGVLAELQDPPPKLVTRVNHALRARVAEKKKMARLEQMNAQHDPLTVRRTRVTATTLLGILWTITPQVVGRLERRYPDYPDWQMYAWSGGVVLTAGLVVLWGRESLTKTMVNRRILATGLLAFAAQLALQAGGHVIGIPRGALVSLHMLVWGTAVALAASVEPRFWYSVATFYFAFILACRWPERRWDLMSASTGVLVFLFLRAWWRPIEDRPRVLMGIRAERLAREQRASKRSAPDKRRGERRERRFSAACR